ncbi:PA14 domain-containing protein [Dactylosporangium salmoneum]|uniref:Glucose/arabinose dehydrogenase n=1 Tax=Dactylosporangium salmoneum TaxID=53361 RepID=A0ABN3GMJ3_9ACTN
MGRLAKLGAVLLLAGAALVATGEAGHAAPPGNFQTSLVQGTDLDGPSGFDIAPDGRIFVLERGGKVKIIKDGVLLAQPFAELPAEPSGDRGLIGIAFDPEFGISNNFVYFYYTGHDLLNHLVRYDGADDIGTQGPYPLFQTSSPSQLLHVGGSIAFGPDGKLYLAIGDNGVPGNAQDLSNPHGKILRINKDGSVPADNPFYGQPGKLGAIWAYGFRNPWRFQFDSATGQLYGGDVGDYTWEELNHIVKGGNYGWPLHEGMCTANCAGFIDPIHTYNHNGQSAAVTGGPIYRGSMFPPEYQGSFFFGDYASGFIKRAQLDANGAVTGVYDFDSQAGAVVDMKVAPDGSLYYITYYPGALYHVVYNATAHAPVASASASVTRGIDPLTVTFSSAGSTDPDGDDLTYLWSFGDGTTSTEANPVKTFTEKGVYTVHLTVSSGGDHTQAQPIVIQVGIPPTLTVALPVEGQLYRAGDTITYNAFASDAAGFDLNDANIKTVVRLHHGSHYHPFAGPLTGRAGSFTIPTAGEASADTSYELTVTATDGNGLSTTKTVTIRPRIANLTLATDPPGLGLTLDSVPVSTPMTTAGVVGFQRQIAAPSTAVAADGTVLQFAGWSDGHSIRHVITTADADTTYTAAYRPAAPFAAEFFDNPTLSGAPVLTRQDAKIDFDWGAGAPDPAVPDNNFSARWSTTQWFGAGRYRFTTMADDGVRLYIDNKRVIDQWQGQTATAYSYDADLGEGDHEIRLEYYEGGGGALVRLSWDSTSEQPDETFHGEYWNSPPSGNDIPATAPDLVRADPAIDFDWGTGSPAPNISVDRFTARWTRTLSLAPGQYEFAATADDGVRLFVDGVPVIDRWVDEAPTTYTATLPMDGGPHTLRMEYFENGGGAVARLVYHRVGDIPATPAYRGEYWNTPDAGPTPAIPDRPADLERSDPEVQFDWYDGSPAPGIGADHFMARWTRTDVLSAGVYRFSGAADDGIRVYVDDVPVVDLWQLQSTTFSVDKVVLAGPHVIRVEYFENASGARAMLDYQRVGEVVPTADDSYAAEYFANPDLQGPPVLTRPEAAVDFNWGAGSPAAAVPADFFSARFTRTTRFEAGTYRFTATGDDGIRVLLDGAVVLDGWGDHAATTYTADVDVPAGPHTVVVEYYDRTGGAVARFSVART